MQPIEADSELLPHPDAVSRPFFEGARQHRLMIQRCKECSTHQLARLACDVCLSPDLDWVTASGLGSVYSFAIVHQNYHPSFADKIPYNISIVELQEGPRVITNILNVENHHLRIGMRVRVLFLDMNKEVSLPKFIPVVD